MKAKRVLSFILAASLMMSAIVCFAEAKTITVTKYKNLALGKNYTTPQAYNIPPEGSTELTGYRDVSGSELTDGKYGESDVVGTEWLGFTKSLTGGSVHTLTVDLGEKKAGINKLNVVAGIMQDWGIDLPASVEFKVSDDGVNFNSLGKAKADSDGMITNYNVTSESGFSGRYFRADVTHGAGFFVFISEFEVCVADGTEEIEVEGATTDEFRFSGTSIVFIDGEGDMRAVASGSTVSEFSKNLSEGEKYLKILDSDGKERKSGYVSTGDVAVKIVDGEETDRATVIVDGDTDGNGLIDAVDYIMVKRQCIGNLKLNGKYFKAAALSEEGKVQPEDYIKIKRQALHNYDILKKYKAAPMLYDNEMTFSMVSPVLYRMETTYKGKKLTLTFDKKSEDTPEGKKNNWGTWNIGTYNYDGNNLAGGGTDWEYVYRASNLKTGAWTWSGGNHGNEKFLSLEIFDTATGAKKDLSVGGSFTAKGVTIVEKTHLHWGDPKDYYAEVTRTYRVAGNRVELDVDYHYVRECYFYMSYTCMFPVYKTFGRHSRIYNTDGTYHDNYTTDGTVYAEYGDHYDRGNESLKVTFWGDKHPDWKFDVEVYTPYDSTDNFSNSAKTMIWDMNRVSDKLYVSKYDSSKSSKIEPDTNLGTRSSWTFYVEG